MEGSVTNGVILLRNHRCFRIWASLFHSTRILESGRHRFRESRSAKWRRKLRKEQSPFRNLRHYAESILQRLRGDVFDEDDPLARTKRHSIRWKKNGGNNLRGRWFHKDFQFCGPDFELESNFHTAYGNNRFSYWSFVDEAFPQWKKRSRQARHNRKRPSQGYEDYDSSSGTEWEAPDSKTPDFTSERLALGLSTSGPLKLDDVKNAYRTCALKWHPDRHQGPHKAVAEEKFKRCSAAYQCICNKL